MAGKRGGEKETTVKTLKRKPANKKDPNAPKKPRNAYMFFSNEKRKEVKDANPELRITDIAKKLGEMWKELDSAEKKVYEEMAIKDKKRYEDEQTLYDKIHKASSEE